MEKDLDIRKPRYSEQILPVPWPLVKSRFHRTLTHLQLFKVYIYIFFFSKLRLKRYRLLLKPGKDKTNAQYF